MQELEKEARLYKLKASATEVKTWQAEQNLNSLQEQCQKGKEDVEMDVVKMPSLQSLVEEKDMALVKAKEDTKAKEVKHAKELLETQQKMFEKVFPVGYEDARDVVVAMFPCIL